MKYFFIIVGLFFSASLSGQKKADLSFEQLLDSAHVYFAQPLETFFKIEKVRSNTVIDFDYALKGRQDPVDIRYKIIPLSSDDPRSFAPQVKMNSLAIHMASNDEERGDMVFHHIDEVDLKPFNAEYGISVFFQPKEKLTDKTHCKATFLFADGKGIICTFLFFSKVDIDLKPYEQNLIFAAGEM